MTNYSQQDSIEFLYQRGKDQRDKLISWEHSILDSLRVWDIHSVRSKFKPAQIKISVMNEFDFKEVNLDSFAGESISIEFSALPINHYIIVGKRSSINVSSDYSIG